MCPIEEVIVVLFSKSISAVEFVGLVWLYGDLIGVLLSFDNNLFGAWINCCRRTLPTHWQICWTCRSSAKSQIVASRGYISVELFGDGSPYIHTVSPYFPVPIPQRQSSGAPGSRYSIFDGIFDCMTRASASLQHHFMVRARAAKWIESSTVWLVPWVVSLETVNIAEATDNRLIIHWSGKRLWRWVRIVI